MNPELLRAALLGALQGATEFLPVSSSGHLVIVPALLGWPDQSLTFDVIVHLATAMAVLLYFRADWLRLLRGAWHGTRSSGAPWRDPNGRFLCLILLASVPAIVAGLALKDEFERLFAAPRIAAAMLLLTGAVLLVAELIGRRKREAEDLTPRDALLVGLAQALAIVPGVSRSGATIAAGLGLGLNREAAARFSFLMAAPIIVGAAAVQLLDFFATGPVADELLPLAVGFVVAFLVGLAAIGGLLAWVRSRPLHVFVAWAWILGLVGLWRLP